MSELPALAAFRGVRYRAAPDDWARLICPPYDVISDEQQAELHQRHPHNAVRFELAATTPQDTPDDNRYTRAAATWHEWLSQGVLGRDETPAVYPYRQGFTLHGKARERGGFFCLLRLEEFERRLTLPHEGTLSAAKQDRLELMRACQAQLSPVLALFKDRSGDAARLLAAMCEEEPLAVADLGDESHTLWRCDKRAPVAELLAVLDDGPFFIADGHHRYETALNFRNEMRARHPDAPSRAAFNYVLTLLVNADDPGLVILPTHRLLRLQPENMALLERLAAERFEVEPVASEQGRLSGLRVQSLLAEQAGDGTVYAWYTADRGFRLLRPKPGDPPAPPAGATASLDVHILHEHLLDAVLSQANQTLRIKYVTDAAQAVQAVDSGHYQCAFLLNPTRVDQVLETALAGERMPGKSTYFYPKAPTGLVMNPVEPQATAGW